MADLDEEIRRANEADRLLNDPMLKGALETMKTAIEGELLRADLNNTDRLKTLVGQYQALNCFGKQLKTTVETGKMARIQKTAEKAA